MLEKRGKYKSYLVYRMSCLHLVPKCSYTGAMGKGLEARVINISIHNYMPYRHLQSRNQVAYRLEHQLIVVTLHVAHLLAKKVI